MINRMVSQSLQHQLDSEANFQGLENQVEDNHENGREYVQIPKTPY
jgi:hypothetical protein